MKTATLLLFIIVSAINTSSYQSNTNKSGNGYYTFYYSTVEFTETPLSHIKGSVPLTKKEAMGRNHYRFFHNERMQLKSISFYNGNIPKRPNHTANLFTLAHKVKFEYTKRNVVLSFYNRFNLQTNVLGNCFSFVYTLNESGFRESLHFLDNNGNRITNSWGIYEYRWEYLADGSVIEERVDEKGNMAEIRPGFEFYRLRLFFNPSGHIALMQNIDAEGNLVENKSGASQDKIKTNSSGNFVEWNVLNNKNELERGNGPDVAIGKQKFNEYGYETELEHQDENGNVISSNYGIAISKTMYDEFGNISERRFYNEQRLPSLHQRGGYHRLVLKWDDSGNSRISLSYYDLNNKPCLHKTRRYHSVSYEYDISGRLSKISYLDEAGNLTNRVDNGRAYTTYKRDKEKGNITVNHFNKLNERLEK